jgi:murein DD-endopeptidase MepM/ murein hydrolase activator NlpD
MAWAAVSTWWFLTSATTVLQYNQKIAEQRTRYEEELLSLGTQAEELKGNDKNLEHMVHVLLTRTKALHARQVLLSSLTERLNHNLTTSLFSPKNVFSAPVHMDESAQKNGQALHDLAHEEDEADDFEGPIHQKPMPLMEGIASLPSSHPTQSFQRKKPQSLWIPKSSSSSSRSSMLSLIEKLGSKPLKDQVSDLMDITQHMDQQYIHYLQNMIQATQKTSKRLLSVLAFLGLKDQAFSKRSSIQKGIGGPLVPVSSLFLGSDTNFSTLMRSLKHSIEETLHLTHVLDYVPIASPKPGPVAVTSSFGVRLDPFTHSMAAHTGVDMRMAHGSPVYATAAGRVSVAQPSGGYGLLVEIDHGYGFRTRYAHLNRIHVVLGQKIQRGIRIGAAGSTGRSTGPHLHYEVRMNGRPTNPVRFLKALTQVAP